MTRINMKGIYYEVRPTIITLKNIQASLEMLQARVQGPIGSQPLARGGGGRGKEGRDLQTAGTKNSFFAHPSTHLVFQLYDLSCSRLERTWASSSFVSVRQEELLEERKRLKKLKPANTRVQKQCVWKERLGRWSDTVNLPDPCGGSQTFDISRNFSSSCMTVRFDKYCFTLRDIMDCVTKQNAKQSKIEQDPRLTWRIKFSNVN